MTVSPGLVSTGGPPPESISLQELAVVLSTLFPVVDGTVTAVQAGRIEIDRGANHGLRPGLLLHVFRTGAQIRHPLTGVVLGVSEIPVGELLVEQTTADHATTRLVGGAVSPAGAESPSEPVRAGDRVRTSDARLPIALASTSASQMVTARFRAAIEETGRFQLLPFSVSTPGPTLIGEPGPCGNPCEKSSTDAPAGSQGPSAPRGAVEQETASLVAAARADGAEYLVLFDARLRPAGAMGAVEIIETREGLRVDAVQMPLYLNPNELAIGGVGASASAEDPLLQIMASRQGQAFRTVQFPYRAEHLVIGDLSGDGGMNMVVSDGSRLRVYRMKDLAPELLAEEPLDRDNRRQLAIDLADVNGAGRPQLFVTAMRGDRLDSYVLEWRDGGLARVVDHQPYYFRVLTPPGRPAMLVGQMQSLTALFYDHVFTLEWTGQGYRKGEALTLPDGVEIYDFTVADLARDGRGQLLYLDRDDRLVLVNPVDGRVMGKSDDTFGGVESYIDRPVAVNQTADAGPLRARIPARLTVADLKGDGVADVVVPHNIPLTKRIERIKMYRYGQLHVLRWDGHQFVAQWTIPRVEGVIADLAVARLLGPEGGSQVMILVNPTPLEKVTDFKELFTTSSQLLFYAMPDGTG